MDWRPHIVRKKVESGFSRDCYRSLKKNQVIVIADFKMKILPMYFRENQRLFFGERGTFHLDESTTTTTLPPPVPRSTRPLRRNSTTLVKQNLLLSINIRHPPAISTKPFHNFCLTPWLHARSVCWQKAASDALHRLAVLSSLSQTTKKNSSRATI